MAKINRRAAPKLPAGTLVTVRGGKVYRSVPPPAQGQGQSGGKPSYELKADSWGIVIDEIKWMRGMYRVGVELKPGDPLVIIEVDRQDIFAEKWSVAWRGQVSPAPRLSLF